jgi:hypothetical protein
MRDPRLWSHGRFWSYAIVLTVLFLLAHLAGFRDHTSVLAGTHSGGFTAQFFGMVYLMLYVTWVCLVPIMVIAGFLLWLGGRLTRTPGDGTATKTPEKGAR